MSPQFVKPYVKSNKNDALDAQAICEAVARPIMRFVVPKTIEQQDIQSLHRIRSNLVGQYFLQLLLENRPGLAVLTKLSLTLKLRITLSLEDIISKINNSRQTGY